MIRDIFADQGRVWLRGALGAQAQDALSATLPEGAVRIGPDHPMLHQTDSWLPAVQAHWPEWRPVRAVAFDKTTTSNWAVPWHQDRVIAVAERRAVPGFDNWTAKDGYWHCSAPRAVLDDMLFVRVHLDACDADSGAMEIARGSHAAGWIAQKHVTAALTQYPTEITEARAGDILVLHMMTLHRSRPSQSQRPRRVLRFDLARAALPGGLQWAVDAARPAM